MVLRGVTVIRCQMLTKIGEIQKTVDATEQMVLRNHIIEIKSVEKWLLWGVAAAHHG